MELRDYIQMCKIYQCAQSIVAYHMINMFAVIYARERVKISKSLKRIDW